MLAIYFINEKTISIHYKLRIRGIFNLVKAYLLGIPAKVCKKIHFNKLIFLKRIHKIKYRKILAKLDNTNSTRRLIICNGFLCKDCPEYESCYYW